MGAVGIKIDRHVSVHILDHLQAVNGQDTTNHDVQQDANSKDKAGLV
jgi:hypothetical protein